MLIVVEGVDGSGKTTFIDELSQYAPDNTVVMHRGPIKSDPSTEYLVPLLDYDPATDNIICDRWHVGELIYGPVYRGTSQLSEKMRIWVELFLLGRGAHMIMLDTPYETILERVKKRGDDMVAPEQIRLIHDFYMQYVAENPHWNVVPSTIPSAMTQVVRASQLGQKSRRSSFLGSSLNKTLYVCKSYPDELEMDASYVLSKDPNLQWAKRRMVNLQKVVEL